MRALAHRPCKVRTSWQIGKGSRLAFSRRARRADCRSGSKWSASPVGRNGTSRALLAPTLRADVHRLSPRSRLRGVPMSASKPTPAVATTVPKGPLGIAKALTGIEGLDELTSGGLPRGRPTLVCGGAGCGKTVLGLEFLIRGATQYGEPGAIFTFEEAGAELAANVASFGFDLPGLIAQEKLVVDHVLLERSEVAEAGDYNLDGLFIRLAHAIDSIGAKRVLIDTPEVLFAAFANKDTLRSELHRLFRW